MRQRGLSRLATPVQFRAEATRARLGLGFDGEDFMQHGHIGLERDAHERVGHGADDFPGMSGFSLPDETEREDGRETFRPGEPLHLERTLERAPGNADDRQLVAASATIAPAEASSASVYSRL